MNEPTPSQRIRRPRSAPVARPLPLPLLREQLSQHVNFVKRVEQKDGTYKFQSVRVPGHVVSAIAARGVWPGLPVLRGIVSHPTLLPDGSVLAAPGYHAGSELLLWLPEGLKVEVPDSPTHADAVKALDALLGVLCDF